MKFNLFVLSILSLLITGAVSFRSIDRGWQNVKNSGLFRLVTTESGQKYEHVVSPPIGGQRTIGRPGAVANPYGAIDGSETSIFASTTDLHIWPLNGNADDIGPNAPLTLASQGTPNFDLTTIFDRKINLRWDGLNALKLEGDPLMDVNGVSFTVAGWFQTQDPDGAQILSNQVSTADRSWSINASSAGYIAFWATNTAGSNDVEYTSETVVNDGKWYHVAMVFDQPAGRVKGYLNGAKIMDEALANVRNTTGSSVFRIGGRNASFTEIPQDGGATEVIFQKGAALTDVQINQLYSRRFTNSVQIAGGHYLTTESFMYDLPSTGGAHWSGQSVSDISGALSCSGGSACDLTPVGVTFDAPDIFGDPLVANFDGVDDCLHITDPLFTAMGRYSWTIGGWFKTNWQSLPGNQMLIANRDGVDFYFDILIDSVDDELFARVFSATSNTELQWPMDPWKDGEWHHIAFSYDSGSKRIALHVDGVEVASSAVSVGIDDLDQSLLTFGCSELTSNWMEGSMQSLFFIQRALTEFEIAVLASAKFNHGYAVDPENQSWVTTWKDELTPMSLQLENGWLKHMASENLYVNFMNLDEGSKVSVRAR
jgi:hypothetical protein